MVARDVPRDGSTDEAAFRDLCLQLAQSGEVTRAKAVALQGIAAFPRSAMLHTYLGNLLAQEGDNEGAVDRYRRALSIGPPSTESHYNLGVVLGKLGRLDEAVASYADAIALNPGFAAAELNVGSTLLRLGRPRDALSHFERAIRIAPGLGQAHLGAASVHQDLGAPELALTHYERARTLMPDDARVHASIGTMLLRLGYAPDLGEAYFGAATTHEASGASEQALAGYERARSLLPDDPRVYRSIGRTLLRLGWLDAAIASFRDTLRREPDDVDSLLGLGSALLQRGDAEEALARYRDVLRLDPGNDPANGLSHLVAALTGAHTERAPDRYVAKLFDLHAERFDSILENDLGYAIPRQIAEILAAHRSDSGSTWEVLDLGCGTGLVGEALAPYSRRMVGVDLSSGMLAKARERDCYERLANVDLVEMMRHERASSFDVVTAADVFIYVGKLDDTVREIANVIRPGGWVAFSVESLDAPSANADAATTRHGYRLGPTARFAHSTDYLRQLAEEHGFDLVDFRQTVVRLERGVPVDGAVVLWRRRSTAACG
ncbi:MAG: tetratricopeptide repeat protein [Vicinamibacteria bacterium]|jgi:predicted TPR repeat methyltransferase